jgi:3-hydroxyacyl-CoA dehydrogenase
MSSPVHYELHGNIGVITVNNPPVNALSLAVRQGMLDAINKAQDDASQAVVIVCDGRTFIAGADITEFGKPPVEPYLPDLLNTIESSSKPVIAAVHGTALGGGLETALAAHYRCALASAKIGLPEVKLGLLPGAGGTQRLPRLAGIKASLDLMTSGAPIAAAEAASIGVIDKVVDKDLLDSAMAWARELIDNGMPVRKSSEQAMPEFDSTIFDEYRAMLEKRARGQIAPANIVTAVEAATTMPFKEGLAKERELFMQCMSSAQSAGMRHVFFAERQAAKIDGLAKDTPVRPVNSVGIIGGGTMGGGIAMSFANAGIPVTMIEISDEALQRGLAIIERNYAGSVKRGKLSEEKAAACRSLISGSTDYARVLRIMRHWPMPTWWSKRYLKIPN